MGWSDNDKQSSSGMTTGVLLILTSRPALHGKLEKKKLEFFGKIEQKFTLHETKTRVLSKNSSFQVAKLDNLTNSKCQVVEFFRKKNSSFEINYFA